MYTSASHKAANHQSDNRTAAHLNGAPVQKEEGPVAYADLNAKLSLKSVSNGSDEGLPMTGAATHHFNKISILPSQQAHLQPKLKINAPGDKYEQEADRMAEQVMRMPVPNIQRKCTECQHEEEDNIQRKPLNTGLSLTDVVHRKCSECGEEEGKLHSEQLPATIQRMESLEEEEEENLVQTKRKKAATPEVDSATSARINSMQRGGQSLSKSERDFFEPRFGADFSGVRIHSNAKAANLAHSINARAFTIGNNIAFGAGEYAPETNTGKQLLAHELTHTIQQSSGVDYVQRGSAGLLGGKCCNPAKRVEWALVGEGVWKKLEAGECTGTTEDCDGMTCGGGFYHVDNLQTGRCSSPRNDDKTFAPRRWTPSSQGADARSPTQEGSTAGDTPPNWEYDGASTVACPDGIRTISVDFIRLHRSTISPAAQLARANTVYATCCVRFVAGATPARESQATTESWLDGDTDASVTPNCGTVDPEEKKMYDKANSKYALSSRMRVFFVDTFSGSNGLAYSIPPYCASGTASAYVNHMVLQNTALPDTLAHEFGHILINSGQHTGIDNPADTKNLMFAPGRTASDLDTSQCATIYGNA